MDWIINNWIEITGTVFGLIFIILEIKENNWMWSVGIITAAFYIIVFYDSKIYAQMGLQAYYLVISFYGWYWWTYGKTDSEKYLSLKRLNLKMIIILSIITIIIFSIITYILIECTDSSIPIYDSILTTLGIIATWMLTQKYVEQWLIWIIADFLGAFIYFNQDLYSTSILYLVFGIVAIIGYFQWQKSFKLSLRDK